MPEKFVYHVVQELLGHTKTCPEEENVEAVCQLFNTIGKQLDESPNSRRFNDIYFSRLEELSTNPQLAPQLRVMVRDVIDLRASSWIPRRKEEFGSMMTWPANSSAGKKTSIDDSDYLQSLGSHSHLASLSVTDEAAYRT